MSTKIKALLLALMAGGLSTSAFGGWFGPSNYDDCVLDKMKGVTSDIAAKEIKLACQNKFPQETIPLTKEAKIRIQKVLDELKPHPLTAIEKGSIKMTGIHPFQVGADVLWLQQEIYNGNAETFICQMTYKYRITPKSEWSNIYRWSFSQKTGGALEPYETRRVIIENLGPPQFNFKALRKQGVSIEYEIIEVIGTTVMC